MSKNINVLLALLVLVAFVSADESVNIAVDTDGTQSTQVHSETHEFQAEVNRLMEIIIHSLYSNKDIFLRELISNSADALEKMRFQQLSDDSLREDSEGMKIHVQADKEKRTLTIRDGGIGMTREELIKNLGTVAHSGTTKFLEASKANGEDAMGLIGQFGVGFYSAFLVADKVTVTSKHVNDTQLVWESDAKSSFQIYEDSSDNLGKHGTSITLHLKDDADEFLSDNKLKGIVDKYSEFINFPIFLRTSKVVSEEVPVDVEDTLDEDAEKSETDSTENTDDEAIDVTEAEDDSETTAETRTVEKTVFNWEHINKNIPLWTRSPSEVNSEEYTNFFRAMVKDDKAEHLKHIHFNAEGQVQFRGLIYIPSKAPHDLYDKYYSGNILSLKLYVRRVLLSEEIDKDFLPNYLSFVRGIIDSDDLPINVSRETLQKSKVLRFIGRNITKRILKMITKLATDSAEAQDEEDKAEKTDSDETDISEKSKSKENLTPYEQFYAQFSRSIKLGVLEDEKNKDLLVKLLRFQSTMSSNKEIGLEEYVDRMPETQNDIYYISGPDIESVQRSPMLEQLKKRNFEVLFFVDNLDEYLVSSVTEFNEKKLVSVSKEGLEFGDESEDEKDMQKDLDADFKLTFEWMARELGEKIGKVVVSRRVTDTPAVLVSTRWGWTANMERIMRAQAMSQQYEQQRFMVGSRTLEINPDHPVIQEIKRRIELVGESGKDDTLHNMVQLLYDSALLNSGFVHEHITDFVSRVNIIMAENLGVKAQPSGERYIAPKRPVEDNDSADEQDSESMSELEDEDEEHDDL